MVMKTMNRMRMHMQMQECYCSMLAEAMTMKGSVYIIGINKVKKKRYEKISFSNSSIFKHQRQQYAHATRELSPLR